MFERKILWSDKRCIFVWYYFVRKYCQSECLNLSISQSAILLPSNIIRYSPILNWFSVYIDWGWSRHIAPNRLFWSGLFAVRGIVSARHAPGVSEAGILLLHGKWSMYRIENISVCNWHKQTKTHNYFCSDFSTIQRADQPLLKSSKSCVSCWIK